jgi:hypothetical protein
MFGRFPTLHRQLAERSRARAKLRRRKQLIVRAIAGAAIGGLIGHEVGETLAVQLLAWWHWSTFVGAIVGVGLVVPGRRGLPATVPLGALLGIVFLSLAVLLVRDDRTPADVAFSAAVDKRLGVRDRDLDVTAWTLPSTPTRWGCGPVEIWIAYESRRPLSTKVSRTTDHPRFRVTVSHPSQVHVKWSPGVSDDGIRILNKRGPYDTVRTVISWSDSDFPDPFDRHLLFGVAVELDGVAVPRGVGSCYVGIPALLQEPSTAPASYLAVRPGKGHTDLETGDGHLVADLSWPTPDVTNSDVELAWNCPQPKRRTVENDINDCNGTAVIETGWHDALEQIGLLVIGALFALLMESVVAWLRGSRR